MHILNPLSKRNTPLRQSADPNAWLSLHLSHLHGAHVAEGHPQADPIAVEGDLPPVKVDAAADDVPRGPGLAVHLATDVPLAHALAV